MGIKKYMFFSMALIVLCGVYVFTFQDASYSIEFFGVPVALKIAVWVVLPMILLAIFSVFHLIFYSFKINMQNRALAKDYEMFLKSAKQALLGENFEPKYKTKWFLDANDMLLALRDAKRGLEVVKNEELKQVCKDVSDIENSEHVNMKFYKLDEKNPLAIKNRLNELEKNPKIASEILRSCESLDSDLAKRAFEILVSTASYTEIKKFNFPLSTKDISVILKRNIDKEDALYINEADIDSLINEVSMSEDEYLQIAKILKKEINPDTLVAMFENIFHKDTNAGKAYFYILFELQMIDKARELLDSTDENEYQEFKTYLFLRDSGQNTDIKLLIK